MLTDKSLKIGSKNICQVENTLIENEISGKILYVSDAIVNSLYGEVVKEQIDNVGYVKEEIIDNNTISYAMNVAERVIATDVACIVAVGGGRVLDVCKYAAFIAKVPILSIPTTIANDGIASPIAVLKRQDNKPKSLGCSVPQMVLIDVDIIANGPIEHIKAGIGDTISNYMSLIDWSFAVEKGKDTMNGYAYLMSQTALNALLSTRYDSICSEFIEVLANSVVMSGIAMDFAKSSRPVSGSEHLFSHALDYYAKKTNLHGFQVALGTIASLKLIGYSYSKVGNYLKRFDVDIKPSHLNISEETFVECFKNAPTMRQNRYTYLHSMDLNEALLKKVYWEIEEEF